MSGCKNQYKFVLGAGAKVEYPPTGGYEIPPWRGKNPDEASLVRAGVTNNLPILSELGFRAGKPGRD